MTTILKTNINHNSLIQLGELLSNSVILGANAFLIGSAVSNSIRHRKQEQIRNNMQLGAEIASAAAGLTKVVIEGIHHGQRDQDIRT